MKQRSSYWIKTKVFFEKILIRHLMFKQTNKPQLCDQQIHEHFTQEQLSLLNKGLNFVIRDPTFPKEDIVIDIEAGIKYTSQEEKAGTREEIRRLLTSIKRIRRLSTPKN